MFNLEQPIAEWRQQMLAAGIQTPVPLEELESHLREEIQWRMKSGFSEQRAFEIATKQIGQPAALKDEFQRTNINTRFISQKFISSMLVISSGSSLAMLYLWLLRPASEAARMRNAIESGKMSLWDLFAAFNGNALLDQTNFVSECLLLSLMLTALFTLLTFYWTKQTHASCYV